MIIDAREHLLRAIAHGRSAQQAVDEHGPAADVVQAVRATVDSPAARAPGRVGALLARVRAVPVLGVWADGRAWLSLLYLVVLMALGVACFAVTITGLALSAGTLVLLIGPAVLLTTLAIVRAMSLGHGWLARTLLRAPMPYRYEPIDGRGVRALMARVKVWFTDPRSYASVLFMILSLPVSLALGVLQLLVLVAGLALLAGPVLQLLTGVAFHAPADAQRSEWTLRMQYDPVLQGFALPIEMLIGLVLLGVLTLTAGLWLAKGLAWGMTRIVAWVQIRRPLARPEVSLA
jgi:hypothetical protein